MSVVSLEAYKKESESQASYMGYTVFDLPLAPQVVSRTRFATTAPGQNRCMILNEALVQLEQEHVEELGDKAVVAISGPGDPLAKPDELLQVMKLLRERFPELGFAIRTHGIGASKQAKLLAEAGLKFVEIITDGVTPEVLEDIYVWIRPGKKTLPFNKAVPLTLAEMALAMASFKEQQVVVYGGITLFPLNNGDEVENISEWLKQHGADGVAVAYAADVSGADAGFVDGKRAEAAAILPVFPSLLQYQSKPQTDTVDGADSAALPKPLPGRAKVAVVSSDGLSIDMHLGQAEKILIYGPRGADGLACLLETRDAPAAGGGGSRWEVLSKTLSDCFTLLAASVGESPRKVLAQNGIRVMVIEDDIEGCVDVLYGCGKKKGEV